MSLNLRAGDLLVVDTKSHPIVWCGEWEHPRNSTVGMKRMCTKTASTKRNPTISGGKRGDPVEVIASLKCTPLDPIGAHTQEMIVRRVPTAPTDLLECIVDGGDTFYHLVVERARE